MLTWVLLALTACHEPTTTTSPGPHELTGRLVDHAGAPIGAAIVLACTSGYCQDATTRSDGTFRFPIKRPITVTLKADGVVAGRGRRAAALLPGVEAGAAPVDVGDLHAPDLPPGVRLPAADEGPRTLELGDGLTLTLDRSALRAPVHTFLYEAAARRLSDTRAAPFAAVVDEPIVAVYAIEPFGTRSSAPIAASVPTHLPAGRPVRFWTLSGTDGTLSAPVPGHTTGAAAVTDAGVGLTELSYLVITEAR